MSIATLELHGTPFEIGYRHGQRYRDAIAAFARERLALAGEARWSGRPVGRARLLELAEECLPAHADFSPTAMEELRGMAEASGVSLPELVIVNGFTDFVDAVHAAALPAPPSAADGDDCTAVLVPDARAAGGGFLAQTWDMHPSATEYVTLLRVRPEREPEYLTFTVAGCVAMIGMNEAGLAVGINNLLGGDGRPGVTWPFVVREMLRLPSVAEALALLERAPLAGAHNYLLMDRSGHGANVEASPTRLAVTPLAEEVLAHTNHCLAPRLQAVERPREAASRASSEARLARARQLLAEGEVDLGALVGLTSDEQAVCVPALPGAHIATCGAAIMRPRSGELWAAKGRPSPQGFRRFTVPA